jgi:hypothetical protein
MPRKYVYIYKENIYRKDPLLLLGGADVARPLKLLGPARVRTISIK